METDSRKTFLINTAFIAVIIALWFIGIKLLSGVLLPFLLAGITVLALRGLTEAICRRLHIKRKLIAVLTVLFFYILIIGAVFLLLLLVFKQLDGVVALLPHYLQKISQMWNGFSDKINALLGRTFNSADGAFNEVPKVALESLTSGVTSFVASLAGKFAAGVPYFLLSLIVMVVASIYLAKDYDDIRAYFIRNFSKVGLSRIIELKDVCFGNLFKIIKSYFIILCITFAELFLGLTVLGFKYSLILALVISLVDILPVLGCGTVRMPWAAVCALNGDIKNAVGLLVLYLVISAVRHFIEPKVIGERVGVHPFLMLLSVIVGLRLFGAAGVLAVPMTVIVLSNLPWHPKSES